MISTDSINKTLKNESTVVSRNATFIKQLTDIDFLSSSLISHKVILEENSKYQLNIMLCHTQKATLEIEIEAQGDDSSFEIVFLYAVSTDQKITIITKQVHTGKKTNSKLLARGIVKDRAVVYHQGLILIEENGQKTEALLEHKALVLGGQAQVILVPSIEVLNHDVQCFHGAAVGQFNQEHVWYLTSRGFNELQAYQILVKSFFGEFIEKFEQSEKLLESLCQKIL